MTGEPWREPRFSRYCTRKGRLDARRVASDISGDGIARDAVRREVRAAVGIAAGIGVSAAAAGGALGAGSVTLAALFAGSLVAAVSLGDLLSGFAQRDLASRELSRRELERTASELAEALAGSHGRSRTEMLVALSEYWERHRVAQFAARLVHFGDLSSLEFSALALAGGGEMSTSQLRMSLARLCGPVGLRVSRRLQSGQRVRAAGSSPVEDRAHLLEALSTIEAVESLGGPGEQVFVALEAMAEHQSTPVWALESDTRQVCVLLKGHDGALEVFCGLAPQWHSSARDAAEAAVAVASAR